MRIKIIQDCKISFSLYEPIYEFKIGQIVDLKEVRANRMLEKKFAEKEAEEISEAEEAEIKMNDPDEKENKLLDVSVGENKKKSKKGKK